jgi:Tol biopolymer transport system component
VKRPAITLLFTVLLVLFTAPPAGGAPSGSILVSQLWLYDFPYGCDNDPCGFYNVWSGRPLGPYAQLRSLGANESYGNYMAPTVSPTGGRLVYTSRGGAVMIADLDARAGTAANVRALATVRTLGNPPTSAAWSPDGGRVVLMQGFDPNRGLWVVNADGTGLYRIRCRCSVDVFGGWGVAWSAGGIAFSGRDGPHNAILVVQPDGSGLHAVTRPPRTYDDSRPAFSPDGSRVAFMRGGGGERGGPDGTIYTVAAAGGPVRRVGRGNAPVFSPDGRYLVYADSYDEARGRVALHITNLRRPRHRVAVPTGLGTRGYIDQLAWLP